jgi:hypothetical protein
MNPRILLAALALLSITALLSYSLFLSRWSDKDPGQSESALEEPLPRPDGSAPAPGNARPTQRQPGTGAVERDAAQQAEERVRDLEAKLALAEERLRRAEQDLERSEAEVEELEEMIAEIKARGEDPADYSDLAMERFQPAFFRFQDAQAAYDSAEQLRTETIAALEAARAALARRRSAMRE